MYDYDNRVRTNGFHRDKWRAGIPEKDMDWRILGISN
jgi:hypothetical protein